VDQPEYKRIVELLLHLDFSTLDKAVGSSQRWVGEVGVGARLEDDIAGTATATRPLGMNGTATSVAGDKVTNLTGLVRRKNPSHSLGADTDPQSDSVPKVSVGAAADPSRTSQVNVLGANLVRKKKKDVESGDGTGSNGAPVR
jgi:regulator of Ty1 transposition protein 109